MSIDKCALIYFTLNSRLINYRFNAQHGINKTDIEVITYARKHELFNAYEVSSFLNQMNVQQLRRSIQKLIQLSILEIIRPGTKNKPALYVLTYKGEQLLDEYAKIWHLHSEGHGLTKTKTNTTT